MWKDEFRELLFSSDETKIDEKKAAKLKYDNFPSSLYQYRRFDENKYYLKALNEDRLYLRNPDEFNDPYDCAFMTKKKFSMTDDILKKMFKNDPIGFKKTHKITTKQFTRLKKSDKFIRDLSRYMANNENLKYKNKPKKLIEISRNIVQNIKSHSTDFNKLREYLLVSCFSEDYRSILMWSHYAEDHTGFCVQYDFKSLGNNSHLTRILYPIFYTNKIFPIDDYIHISQPQFHDVHSSYLKGINLNKILEGTELKIVEKNSETNNMFQTYTALNKYEGWEYEKEWRYVLYCHNESKHPYIHVPKPKAIYLGAKSDNNDAILEIAEGKNIDVYQMYMKSSEYALQCKKIL